MVSIFVNNYCFAYSAIKFYKEDQKKVVKKKIGKGEHGGNKLSHILFLSNIEIIYSTV